MAISNRCTKIIENQNNKQGINNNKNYDNFLIPLAPHEKLEFNRTLEQLLSTLNFDSMDMSESQLNGNFLSISKPSNDVPITIENFFKTNDIMTSSPIPPVNMQFVFKILDIWCTNQLSQFIQNYYYYFCYRRFYIYPWLLC